MPQKPPGDPPQRWRATELKGATGLNERTGELIELGTIRGLSPVRPRKTRKEIRFMLVDIEAMPHLELSRGEWRLFWTVVNRTDRERGEARIANVELSRELGWRPPNTSRAMAKLTKRGIFLKLGVGVWMVNPRLMTRNSVARWELDQSKAPEIDWKGEDDG